MKKSSRMVALFLFSLVLVGMTKHVDAATPTKAETEAQVREYFKDTPVMIEIARCESNFRQFTDSGSVLKGGSAGGMIGIFQFFESIHAPAAKNLGFDLATIEGNLAYAKHLHKSEGTTPWASAKDCWDVKTSTSKPTDLKREKLQQQIVILKKLIAVLQQQLRARQR